MEHSSTSPFRPGDLIKGRYAVLAVCGSGGMGSIYRVRDTAVNNREAALKVLSPALISQDESATERFRREAVIAAGLRHPNIVEVYDFSLDPSGPMIMAMEFVEGISLAQRINSLDIGKLSFPQIVRILKDISAGLAFAHEQGVIHRDLKPANILVGSGGVAKIADFGLCRSDIFEKSLTQVGECVGTPLYMAPEQITSGYADARSDIYSFGILAYELVSGRVPFNGDTWFEIAEQHLAAELPPIDLSLPAWFDELLEICTHKDAKRRFASGTELVRWLDEHSSEQTHRPQLIPDEPFVSKVSFAVVAVCSFLLVSVGLSSGMLEALYRKVHGASSSSEPLPASAFVPVVQRVQQPTFAAQRLHGDLSPPSTSSADDLKDGKRKVYVCKINGTNTLTTSPPPGRNCVESK